MVKGAVRFKNPDMNIITIYDAIRAFFFKVWPPAFVGKKATATRREVASRQAIICNYMYLHLPNSTMDDDIKERFIPG